MSESELLAMDLANLCEKRDPQRWEKLAERLQREEARLAALLESVR